MRVNVAICLLMLFAFVAAAAKGYKKGLFVLVAPILTFILAITLSKSGLFSNIPDFCIETNTGKVVEQIISHVQEETLFNILSSKAVAWNSFSTIIKGFYGNDLTKIERNINISQTIQFLILYFIISIIFNTMFKSLSKKMVINSLNRILGVVFNVAWCIVRFWILVCFIYILSTFIPPVQEIQNILMTSNLYKYMFDINPIL